VEFSPGTKFLFPGREVEGTATFTSYGSVLGKYDEGRGLFLYLLLLSCLWLKIILMEK
jgi:hypothetical protein